MVFATVDTARGGRTGLVSWCPLCFVFGMTTSRKLTVVGLLVRASADRAAGKSGLACKGGGPPGPAVLADWGTGVECGSIDWTVLAFDGERLAYKSLGAGAGLRVGNIHED